MQCWTKIDWLHLLQTMIQNQCSWVSSLTQLRWRVFHSTIASNSLLQNWTTSPFFFLFFQQWTDLAISQQSLLQNFEMICILSFVSNNQLIVDLLLAWHQMQNACTHVNWLIKGLTYILTFAYIKSKLSIPYSTFSVYHLPKIWILQESSMETGIHNTCMPYWLANHVHIFVL